MALSADPNRRTVGVAAKVAWPLVGLIALGVASVVAGELLDEETLRTVGLALLGATVPVGGLGWAAKPAITTPRDPAHYGEPRDQLRLRAEDGLTIYEVVAVLLAFAIIVWLVIVL